ASNRDFSFTPPVSRDPHLTYRRHTLDASFIVVADDHAGHGRTAMQSGQWADAGDNSAEVVISDELTLQQQLTGHPGWSSVTVGVP
ncbi:hypothetical protein ABEP97_11645, partial [Cutibacterium acnes]